MPRSELYAIIQLVQLCSPEADIEVVTDSSITAKGVLHGRQGGRDADLWTRLHKLVVARPGMAGQVIPDCPRAPRYQMLGCILAKGSYGEVYVALDTTDGTLVALNNEPTESVTATRELSACHSLP